MQETHGLLYTFRALAGAAVDEAIGLNEAVTEFLCDQKLKSIVPQNVIIYNNFEIGKFSFFRSDAYQRYFRFLDNKAGFHHHR